MHEDERGAVAFALIRAEASGLDVALTEWTAELRSDILLEQLGGVNMAEHTQKIAQEREVVLVGVSCDPIINARRLAERNEKNGQSIPAEQLVNAVQVFSTLEQFKVASEYTARSVLLDSTDGYRVIYASENGQQTMLNTNVAQSFIERSSVAEEQIIQAMAPL